ncbi:hypothetical protein [Legionella sp. 227]|uniref:hypothetical protein n=1 Tax=Legionella sp. 227 TaxID=3367288 RepID=UPI00370DC115
MALLPDKAKKIITLIQKNHKELLQSKMVAHLRLKNKSLEDPEIIGAWVEKIAEVRTLENSYLNEVTNSPNIAEKIGSGALAALAGGGLGSAVFLAMKVFSTSPIGWVKELMGLGSGDSRSIVEQAASGVFSAALAALTTKILYDSFISSYSGDKSKAKEEFEREFKKEDGFSKLIKDKAENLSIQMIQLFHFREMLLLGKISDNANEIDARKKFIEIADLKNKSDEAINAAIEAYFLKELNKLFNLSFKELYDAHAKEIDLETSSPFRKWFHQHFDSTAVRQNSSQQIQLKFMELCRDYLLREMNEPGFFAKYPKTTATIGGILVGALVLGTLALALGGPVTWGIVAIALVAFAVAAVSTYLIVTHIDRLHYKRSAANREEIQQTVDQVENEFLRLNREIIESHETSELNIKQSKDFDKATHRFWGIGEKQIARGSMEGWLREYATRYRHSKAIEIDLGDSFIELINESEKQTQDLVKELSAGKSTLLEQFIKDTKEYLLVPDNKKTIEEFELIQKIKEQVIHIVSSVETVPEQLLAFYELPINQGGLGGFKSDLSEAVKIAPIPVSAEPTKSYEGLLKSAKIIYKNKEPLFEGKKWFKGDAALREMLGLPGRINDLQCSNVTSSTIDEYLNNSYEFLFRLNPRIYPGNALNPLEQQTVVSPEFLLYRTLLLRQLADLCDTTNYEIALDVKTKIRKFVKERLQIDDKLVFDDLQNQKLMMEKHDDSSRYFNGSGQTFYFCELDNVAHAIHVDIAYNSVNIKPRTTLDFYINLFLQNEGQIKSGVFAYGKASSDLNPQGTKEYVDRVNEYINNTLGFIRAYPKNEALIATGIMECYKHSVSVQVYQIMYRIIKDIKEIEQQGLQNDPKIDFLRQALTALTNYSSNNCFPLKEESSLKKLLNSIQNPADLPPSDDIGSLISEVSSDLKLN